MKVFGLSSKHQTICYRGRRNGYNLERVRGSHGITTQLLDGCGVDGKTRATLRTIEISMSSSVSIKHLKDILWEPNNVLR
uniref:Uncharacterized protein n=1 Tax=Ascaris lumbricoides TaxID=6252 RepID=A0A0M3HZ84_ASCLU